MKPIKYINTVKRPVVRPCPCAVGQQCCNYVVISHILNCPYDCSYCFLQTFFGRDEIVILQDEEKIIAEVKDYMEQAPVPLRIGTGQYSDSLALSDAVSLGKKLVNLFAAQDRHLFELKTKSSNINELLKLEHNNRTVIAWSVNPESIVRSEELGAVNLKERLAAAKKCLAAGYAIAFHFDPIIHFNGWETEYQKIIAAIFEVVPADKIAWISLGALRFQPQLKEIIKARQPHSAITFGELDVAADGKVRYFKPVRVEIFKKMHEFIRSYSQDVYVYLCMEGEDVWQGSGLENNPQGEYAKYFKFSNLGKQRERGG